MPHLLGSVGKLVKLATQRVGSEMTGVSSMWTRGPAMSSENVGP